MTTDTIDPLASPEAGAEAADSAGMPDVSEPLKDDAAPAGFAALAGRRRLAAEQARSTAERDRTEAETLLAGARAEVARIMAEAETSASTLGVSAAKAERDAGIFEEDARLLSAAASAQAQAVAADTRVAELEDERDRLTAVAAELGERLGRLRGERGHLAGQLAAALDAADIDAATAHRGRAGSLDGVISALAGQQAAAQARITAIGDGTVQPWPQKELYEARTAAWQHRRGLRDALNMVWPGRAEAVRGADAAKRRAEATGNLDVIVGQAMARDRALRRVVRL
jgi:hypothetical protein